MGSCIVETIELGRNAHDAYDNVVEECLREYGDDTYNGSFSTCSLDFVHNLSKDGSLISEEKARKFLEDRDVEKWTAEAVDMGIHHYEVRKCRVLPVKSPKTLYAVQGKNYFRSFDTLAKAKDATKALALEHGATETPFTIVKYCGEPNGLSYGEAKVEVKTYKKRPKKIPANAVLAEIHQYYFMGCAAI